MRRHPTWIFALLVFTLMLAGAWFALRPRESLTILTLLNRVTDGKEDSALIDEAVLLAMEEAGHLAGRYRLVVERREIRPEFDVYRGPDEAVEEAIGNPRIAAIIGASRYHTGTILARLNRAGILVVSPADAASELTKPGYGYSNYTPESYRPSGDLNFFRTIPPDDVIGRGCAEWAVKRGWRTAFILRTYESTRRSDEFLRSAGRLGLTIVGETTGFEEEIVDKILQALPDVLYASDDAPCWMVPELRCLGWNGIVLLRGEQVQEEDVPEDGTFVVSHTGPPADFVKTFTGRFGHPPGLAGWYGYRAAKAVVDAIDRADSGNKNEIRRACARNPAFDANGDPVSNELKVSIFREGRRVYVEKFIPSVPPPPPPKPFLTLSFEGTWESQFWGARNAMISEGMRGTFYIDPARIGGRDFLSREYVGELEKSGHEIIEGPAPQAAVGPGKSLEELKAIVDKALAERKPVELRFQRLEDFGDPAPDLFSGQEFWELCRYITSKGFKVIPSRDLPK